jgi:hypothetical protein
MTDTLREEQGGEKKYISIANAGKNLGVSRTTMYYYIEQFKLKVEKFPLDRKAYIAIADLDRIKAAKQAAVEGQR